ncbi:MAG TPA: hypothetical protein VK356_09060, partial [Thermomicrobiales bacterium]|nr:hypothetical protein [Thermomicrobiales bacterium]
HIGAYLPTRVGRGAFSRREPPRRGVLLKLSGFMLVNSGPRIQNACERLGINDIYERYGPRQKPHRSDLHVTLRLDVADRVSVKQCTEVRPASVSPPASAAEYSSGASAEGGRGKM